MNFTLVVILSLSIIIPAMIGLIRFAKINEAFYPFIFCIWLGSINEIISVIIVTAHHSNAVNGNIYLLAESLLLVWQFQRWKLFNKNSIWFIGIVASLLFLWCTENFIISGITHFDSYFRIYYSTLLTFMSISILNRLIVTERRSLMKNPVFIICVALIIYYTMSILAEVFWIYGISLNKTFQTNVYHISVITNFISIILYTLAILWMPIKQRFSLPSS